MRRTMKRESGAGGRVEHRPLRYWAPSTAWWAATVWWRWATFFAMLPYRVLMAVLPDSMEPTVNSWIRHVEVSLYPVSMAVDFVQDASYAILQRVDELIDYVWTNVVRVHHENMRHFTASREGLLRWVEERAHAVEHHGLQGLMPGSSASKLH